MGEVKPFRTGYSISRLADEFRMDRKTVSKRIQDAGIAPSGKAGGYHVYHLVDVALAIVAPELAAGEAAAGVIDPRDLPPKDRKDYFQSENERLKVETTMGMLVPAVEVESEMAELVKVFVQFLDTLPDVLERKLALEPKQVESVQERCDHIRQQMYDKLVGADPDGDVRERA